MNNDLSPIDAPELFHASDLVLERARPGQILHLPTLAGLDPDVCVRWLYRRALQRSAAWFPLIGVDLRSRNEPIAHLRERLAETMALAKTGWLYLVQADPPKTLAFDPTDCAVLVSGGVPGGSERIDVPGPAAAHIRHLDQFHLVETDPALQSLRTALLAHCRSAGVIHVAGPTGAGKTALCMWAHTKLDSEPLVHIAPGRPARSQPGRWQLYDDIASLDNEPLTSLRRLILEREPQPLPPPRPTLSPLPKLPSAFDTILGRSEPMVRLLEESARVAIRLVSVLLLGEPGVGKERLARALHAASGRTGPFVAIDLGSLPEDLVSSELFGYEKGAFTSADRRREGAFRQAHGGTLFLDEIGNLSVRNQAVLLRVLQEKVVRAVGADREQPVDVRVIAATNADLHTRVVSGSFRQDLLDRLQAVTLRIPPLRERTGDVPILAHALLREELGLDPGPNWLTPDARRLLESHWWPGNVRELAGIAANIAAHTSEFPIRPADLGPLSPSARRSVPLLTTSADPRDIQSLDRSLAARLTAIQLHLPPLRDRGLASLHNAIFGTLFGRTLSRAALGQLERHPWWGNFTELHASLDAVRASVDHVDTDTITTLLPNLLQRHVSAPICAVLNPRLLPDGTIAGLRTDFDTPTVIIGRVRSWAELERAYRSQHQARIDILRGIIGSGVPGFLDLPWVNSLSRAHLAIGRDAQGLVVHKLPGVSSLVRACPLDEEALREVEIGAPISLREAGEVRLLDPAGGPDLQLFLFAGLVALDQLGPVAVKRCQGAEARPTREEQEDRPVVWQLNEREIAALNDLVLSFEGGSFKAHIEQTLLERQEQPGLARLANYLLGPRPTQYCTRLYEHPTNSLLRDALRDALSALPEQEERKAKLPTGIQRCISQ